MRQRESKSRPQIVNRLKMQISRLRHRRGHGVHSPYIYNIVREVFMSRSNLSVDSPLYAHLCKLGVKDRYAREIENLRHHCGLSTFEVDSLTPSDMTICSCDSSREMVEEIVRRARVSGTTVVILSPYINHKRGEMCDGIISSHRSTTVNRLGYLIIFNNHLPKQHFTL